MARSKKVVFPLFAFIVLVWFWSIGSLWPRVLAAACAITSAAAWIANIAKGGETILRVTRDEVIADGNLGKLLSTHEEFSAPDISLIRYESGREGGLSGLVARHGWSSTLLLPGISPDQANLVINAIRQKFPEISTEISSPLSMSDLSIFGGGPEITTLDLSNSRKEKGDERRLKI